MFAHSLTERSTALWAKLCANYGRLPMAEKSGKWRSASARAAEEGEGDEERLARMRNR